MYAISAHKTKLMRVSVYKKIMERIATAATVVAAAAENKHLLYLFKCASLMEIKLLSAIDFKS